MGVKHKTLALNPLHTKADLQDAFLQLTQPLHPYYSEGKARLKLPGLIGAGYASVIAEMEGFSRVMWGLIPLLAGGGIDEKLLHYCLKGIENGTNPSHTEYWGDITDYDQRLVEMASLGFALALIPEKIWEPLSIQSRQHFYTWLNQINSHSLHDCNWLFFNVLVNIGFKKIGLPYHKLLMEKNLERIEAFYVSDGWYSDGQDGHSDYYVPFAFQYYGLLYVKLMAQEDPERADRFRAYAHKFSHQFVSWFTEDGRSIPYGRSLTYRFSQGAFWGALVFSDLLPYSTGVIKGIYLRHLRWWFNQPMFTTEGLLTIGYTYPNLIMAENYNAAGSVYWALKAFLPLALPDHHPFWSAEELPLPSLSEVHIQPAPHLIICRQSSNDHVAAFNAGHHQSNEHTHTSAKYEKFVYSSAFGFNVPRAEWGLSQGAFDSMLALSEGDNLYRVRRKNEVTCINNDIITAVWKPWCDVQISTTIIAGLPWHLRVHVIRTSRELHIAEGGYSLPLNSPVTHHQGEVMVFGENEFGKCGIIGMAGFEDASMQYVQSNTNVMHPRVEIPTLKAKLSPGVHLAISGIYGEPVSRNKGFTYNDQNPYSVIVQQDILHVSSASGKQYSLSLLN